MITNKGLQKARGPRPAFGQAQARLWAGRATGLILGSAGRPDPARRPAPLKKNYKNKKY